jgi:hypothetical protein
MKIMSPRLCLVLALLTAPWWPLNAIERKPLPQFSVIALDGTGTASDALVSEEKWLLLYIQAGCAPCDGLLRSIEAEQSIAGKLTVVVGGADAAVAARLAAAYPKLAGSRWYGDPKKSMGRVLPLAGAPVVFGLRGKMLEWSRAGLVPDERSVISALASWVRPVR